FVRYRCPDWRAFNAQDAGQATFESRQSVIDNGVVARHLEFELDDDGTARCNAYRLYSIDGLEMAPPSAYTRSNISPMTWNDEVKFGPPTPKKIRTVSPTLACSGCSFDSAPTEPFSTKYSGRSSNSFSTLN